MALITPGSAPAGSGRGGARRSAAKSTAKRLAGLLGRSVVGGITKHDFKRLARRAGVKRISAECFDQTTGMPAVLVAWLRKVVPRLIIMAEHARRHTVISNDVAYVMKQLGTTMYGQGLDWTYGHYTRAFLQQRLERRLPRVLLQAAAEARAQSEAGSAGAAAQRGATPAPSVNAAAERRAAASPAPSTAATAPATAAAEPAAPQSVDASVATGLGRAAAARQRMEAEAAALQAARQQQQQQAEAAAAAAEGAGQAAAEAAAALMSPEVQKPVAAAAAAGGKGPASAAPAIPTPEVQPLTEERALAIQGWLSAAIQPALSQRGYASCKDLLTVMLARHACTAGEVRDVLFALERRQDIMLDGDDIYVCT
ncbi:hypothetical protein ABPG75_011224 [Micractinium tetrahymenae]